MSFFVCIFVYIYNILIYIQTYISWLLANFLPTEVEKFFTY